MKIWLAILIIWNVVMILYSIGVSIGMGEEIERKDNAISYLQKQLSEALKKLEHDTALIADLGSQVQDPHTKTVGFCCECKNATYSKTLGCYLCGGLEKTEFEFCSDFKRKNEG